MKYFYIWAYHESAPLSKHEFPFPAKGSNFPLTSPINELIYGKSFSGVRASYSPVISK